MSWMRNILLESAYRTACFRRNGHPNEAEEDRPNWSVREASKAHRFVGTLLCNTLSSFLLFNFLALHSKLCPDTVLSSLCQSKSNLT